MVFYVREQNDNPKFRFKGTLIAPTRASKVNNKDSFTRDNSQDFPPVIILSSLDDKVNKIEAKLVWVKGSKIVLNITKGYSCLSIIRKCKIHEIFLFVHLKRNRATDY